MSHHHGFEQGIARQTVGPVQTRACDFTAGIEPIQLGRTVQLGRNASTGVMGGGYDRIGVS